MVLKTVSREITNFFIKLCALVCYALQLYAFILPEKIHQKPNQTIIFKKRVYN